jgi:hypothetical protein
MVVTSSEKPVSTIGTVIGNDIVGLLMMMPFAEALVISSPLKSTESIVGLVVTPSEKPVSTIGTVIGNDIVSLLIMMPFAEALV